ncbi:hypothetical protein I3843_12G040900 [Carya illinoinensis]|nr:hypothetical protein I3843_12G040900 [Carya illinoinensis]
MFYTQSQVWTNIQVYMGTKSTANPFQVQMVIYTRINSGTPFVGEVLVEMPCVSLRHNLLCFVKCVCT